MSGPVANKQLAAGFRNQGKPVTVDSNATQGAQIGVNLWDANGSLITQAQWNALTTTTSGSSANISNDTTDDLDEGQFNLYFTNLRAQNAVGAILENSANVTLTYVTGTSITANLTPVTLTSGGTLALLGFDTYGRLSETASASTTNLPEGTNLYFTNARVQTYLTTVEGQPNGIATLDSTGKLNSSQLPAIAVNETYVESSQAAMLALSADVGDTCVRTDINETFILSALPASTLANWVQLLFPTSGVTSFNGRTGPVIPAANDYTFAQLASTPTTLAGYGITNGVTNTTQVIAGTGLSGGGALSGNVTLSLASQAATTLLGNPAATLGTPVAITIGSGLSLSTGGVLSATGGGGSGTVTSVALTAPGIFAVGGSPITTSGTLAITLATQNANLVWAGPSSGSAAAPTFRSLVPADIPSLPYAPAFTNQSANLVFAGPASGPAAAPGFRSLVAADIPALSYVTSVNVAAPTQFNVTGGPITGSGTLTIAWANQTANTFLAGPTSGSSAAPTFRAPVLADIGVALPNGYIDGAVLAYVGTASLSVSSGNCFLPNGTFWANTTTLTLSGITLTASTFYHVYAYLNSGVPAIECVTTAPASPYSGTARAKTGDTSRRYLGTVLTNSSSQIIAFAQVGNRVTYIAFSGSAPFLVVSNGTATSMTNVPLNALIPTTAGVGQFVVQNSAIGAALSFGPGTGYNIFLNSIPPDISGFNGVKTIFDMALGTDQSIIYELSATPSSGGANISVQGYTYSR